MSFHVQLFAANDGDLLHLLLSAIGGAVALGFGVMLLMANYSVFSDDYTRQRYIQALEQRTGKSYAEWREEQRVRCSKKVAESKETPPLQFALYPQDWKEHLHRICMMIPVTEPVPDSDVVVVFSKTTGHWVLGYVVVTLALAWLFGFMLAKALPRGTSAFWSWLTSGAKP